MTSCHGEFPSLPSQNYILSPKAKHDTCRGQISNLSHTNLQPPLSAEAFEQFLILDQVVHNFQPANAKDEWTYIWGRPGFSCSKAYGHLTGSRQTHPVFGWMWKSSCQHKHKVFFWLLAHYRPSTRSILRRTTMHLQSYDCVLYDEAVEETISSCTVSLQGRAATWLG